jgi:hypothetical protein
VEAANTIGHRIGNLKCLSHKIRYLKYEIEKLIREYFRLIVLSTATWQFKVIINGDLIG